MTSTVLDVYKRQVVFFDPENTEHRRQVAQFHRTGTWGKSPVLFYCPPNTNVRTYTAEELLKYYMSREFSDRKLFAGKKT